jgi:DNA-binding NarL/FixJ family response regulator
VRPAKILVVEDFEPFRRLICSMLGQKYGCQLIESSDGLDALQTAGELQPDFAVLDIGLPGLNGLELARQLRVTAPLAKIAFVTQEFSSDVIREALDIGAVGYVQKTFARSQLLPAIDAVLCDAHFVSGRFANRRSDTDQEPFQHDVQFYSEDAVLVRALSDLVHSALAKNKVAVVVATDEHRSSLIRRLASLGLECARAESDGRLILLDAQDTLSKFVVDRMPDANRFSEVIGGVLTKAAASTSNRSGITVFGEMVALLWANGYQQATICLEKLWNNLASEHHFSLSCAYPTTDSLSSNRHLITSVCSVHSGIQSI